MSLENNWKQKSLQILLKKNEGKPGANSSFLVNRCLQLHKIPLINFTVEDLRIMIGQDFGLKYLVPLAIEKLQENILAEGDYYPGDLLKYLINIDAKFWLENKKLYKQLKQMIEANLSAIENENISLTNFL